MGRNALRLCMSDQQYIKWIVRYNIRHILCVIKLLLLRLYLDSAGHSGRAV